MENNVLKEFLVAVGFKIDETGMRKQQEALKSTERAVFSITKAEADADAARQRQVDRQGRHMERQKSTYADLATAANLYARAIVSVAETVTGAVAKMLGGYDQFHFIAQRTGAAVGQIKGLGYAFDQVGSSAEQALSAIESFAKARRSNPGVNDLIRSMNVSTRGDSVDVLSNSIDAIAANHPRYTGAQIASQLGISEEQYETFSRYRKEIKAFREEYAKIQSDLKVNSDETSRASANISKSWNSVIAVLGVLTEKLYTQLAPVLERIVNGFKSWLAANPEKVEAILQGIARAAEAVGQAIIKFGDWISDEDNQKKVLDFWTNVYGRIEKITSIIGTLLGLLTKLMSVFDNKFVKGYGEILFGGGLAGQLFGGSAQAAEGGAGAGAAGGANDNVSEKPGLFRRGWNAVKRGLGIGDNSPPAGSSKPLGAIGRNANAQTIIRTLREAGYNDNAIAAVVGSMQTESSFNPRARNNITGGHTGLWQWDRNRWPRIKAWIEGQGGDPADAAWQTKAWMAEHNAKPGDPMYDHRRTQRGGEILRNNPSLGEAIHGVRESERFGAGEEGGRARNAEKWLPVVRQPSSASPAEAPKLPSMARQSFNFNDYMRSAPMGTTSNSTDMSRTLNNNAPVTVNVQGGNGDAAAIGAATARGAAMAGDMNLRNVQTALR
jgi:hypothetical protein